MASDFHRFSGNYMILRPEQVSLCHLFAILCNRDIAQRAFIEFPTEKEENLQRRWLIFISLSGQKFLQHFKIPMACFGSVVEMWLYSWSSNSNFFVLLFRLLKNENLDAERSSKMFLSIIGHIDKRVRLDRNINHGDSRYYAMLCAMASKLSYENETIVKTTVEDCWQMESLEFYDFWNDFQNECTTQVFMFRDNSADPDTIVIAFRGTELFDADAWCTDIDISWYELQGMGRIHGGFMKALGLLIGKGWPKEINELGDPHAHPLAYYTLREKLKELLLIPNSKTKFIVTGHSLGGALAILFPAILALHEESLLLERLEGVYTFGQPRVGDEMFKMFMENQMQRYGFKYLRFVYCNDVIPRLPSDDSTFLFKHFGTCLYYNSCYQGKIVEEEPYKNYISPFATIPRILNAFWELFRSFTIPYTKGPDYTETWLLKLVRFVGLALPGLAAHNLQDYVNVTRLSSPAIYAKIEEQNCKMADSSLARDSTEPARI